MGTNNPTDPKKAKKAGPPVAGDRPSLRIDDDLAADLADIMRVHPTFADAVRQAVGQLATQYRTAWAHRVCPSDTAPIVVKYQLAHPATMRRTRPIGQRVAAPPSSQQLRPVFVEQLLGRPTQQAPATRPDAERTAHA